MPAGNQQLSQKVFQNLKGNWLLQRANNNKQIAIASAAFISAVDNHNTLFYREEGAMLQEQTNFYREYEYQLDANVIKVFFVNQENKFFHTLDFSLNKNGLMVANAVHHCASDIYRINYTIYSPDELTITYEVLGPEKKYMLSTNYKRN